MPLEPVLVLLLRVLPVQEQIQILKDALEGIVQVPFLILSDGATPTHVQVCFTISGRKLISYLKLSFTTHICF